MHNFLLAILLLLPCAKTASDPDLVIHYLGDDKAYTLPAGYVHDVLPDKTMNADAFVEAYYEPLRARLPGYITREAIGVDDSGKYTMWC